MRRPALLPLSLLILALLLTACAAQTADRGPWTATPTVDRGPWTVTSTVYRPPSTVYPPPSTVYFAAGNEMTTVRPWPGVLSA